VTIHSHTKKILQDSTNLPTIAGKNNIAQSVAITDNNIFHIGKYLKVNKKSLLSSAFIDGFELSTYYYI
jgi:hypothetical protein